MTSTLSFRVDDLTDERVRALVRRHLDGMFETSPPENVFALDLDGLTRDGVTFYSGWDGDDLVVIGALKTLDQADGELKSMRVADDRLGTGAGRAMLRHLIAEARERGMTRLWLETGGHESFGPAVKLYASEGFVETGPFAEYEESPHSLFMTKDLRTGVDAVFPFADADADADADAAVAASADAAGAGPAPVAAAPARRPRDIIGIVALVLALVVLLPSLLVFAIGFIPDLNPIWWLGILLLPILTFMGAITLILGVVGIIVGVRRRGGRVPSIVAVVLSVVMLLPAALLTLASATGA